MEQDKAIRLGGDLNLNPMNGNEVFDRACVGMGIIPREWEETRITRVIPAQL